MGLRRTVARLPCARALLVLAIAAAIAVGACAGGASSAVSATERGRAAPTEIRLISITTGARDTDAPPKGASKGDRTVGSSDLYNGVRQFGKKAGAKVGSDRSVFVLRSEKVMYGSGTATLPGGTVHFQGVAVVTNGAYAFPVTRGTGVYAGATGQLLIPLTPPGTRLVPNVYRLSYAPVA